MMDLLTLSIALMELTSTNVVLTTPYARLSLITLLGILKAIETVKTVSRLLNMTFIVRTLVLIIVMTILLLRLIEKDYNVKTRVIEKDLQLLTPIGGNLKGSIFMMTTQMSLRIVTI